MKSTRTPSDKVQKYLLRQQAIILATWDRVRTGYELTEERKRAAVKRQGKGESQDGN